LASLVLGALRGSAEVMRRERSSRGSHEGAYRRGRWTGGGRILGTSAPAVKSGIRTGGDAPVGLWPRELVERLLLGVLELLESSALLVDVLAR
jgi:hypothetical protein